MPQQQQSVLVIPTQEFRSIPIPGLNGSKAKLATFFVKCSDVPSELREWMKVNPRIPKVDKKSKLNTPTGKAIIRTLQDEPQKFALKNQGIWIIAENAEFVKEHGGVGAVRLVLSDQDVHGIVNGGHTFVAIEEVKPDKDGEWGAYVRLHVLTAIEGSMLDISDLAEGLNRSLQVDDPSLENLKGHFGPLQEALEGKKGADKVVYKQGMQGDIDVLEVLSYLNLLDIDEYPNRKTHPNVLFGHPKAVLQTFIKDTEEGGKLLKKLAPVAHEILVLSERICQATAPYLAKRKVADVKKGNRLNSPENLVAATFADGTVSKRFPLGWVFPMLAAFRADIDADAWKKGTVKWIVPVEKLLEAVAEEFAAIVGQEHDDNKGKPAEVGRKEAAYRLCYGAVVMELAKHGVIKE